MKRTQNRKATVRRERMIMLISSAFVLAALVGVGFYMRGQTVEEQDDGYEIDFAQLETNVSDKYQELTGDDQFAGINADDALDYMPREEVLEEGLYMEEANSGQVEIGKKQDTVKSTDGSGEVSGSDSESALNAENNSEGAVEEATGSEVEIAEKDPIVYNEASGLYMPVNGEILMHFDMEHTVYFATLDQYKYNPATIISAKEGDPVYACADATVTLIYSNEEIGNAICLDLGNGYQVTYGQLKDIRYKEGDVVSRGAVIASVAAPTKYYSVEGTNLYFALKKDGEAKNAESLLPIG